MNMKFMLPIRSMVTSALIIQGLILNRAEFQLSLLAIIHHGLLNMANYYFFDKFSKDSMWFKHYSVEISHSPYEHLNSQPVMKHPVFKSKQSVVNFTWNQLLMFPTNKQVDVLVMMSKIVQVNNFIN